MTRTHHLTQLKRFWIGLTLAVVLLVVTLVGFSRSSMLTSVAVVHASDMKSEQSSPSAVDPERRVVENRMNDAAIRSLGSGEASYYGAAFSGRPTASGERFDPAELTAAHRTLPFGSKVRVTNLENGRTIVVRVNDRGPYADNRVIDLSRGAAERIGMIQSGTASVKLDLIA